MSKFTKSRRPQASRESQLIALLPTGM